MASRDLKFEIDASSDRVLVHLKGRLDVNSAGRFEEEVAAYIGDGTHIILDMAQINYVSSAGMRSIVTLLKKTRRNHGELEINNPSNYVSNILDMMGLNGQDDDSLPITNA